MGSFSDEAIVKDIIAGNGRMTDDQEEAPDNPRAIKIVEYKSPEGATNWGIVFENEHPAYYHKYDTETEYVRDPVVIWTYQPTVTEG
jgi:hypothetical protein